MPASRLMSLEGAAYLANKKGGDSVDEPPPFVMLCYRDQAGKTTWQFTQVITMAKIALMMPPRYGLRVLE